MKKIIKYADFVNEAQQTKKVEVRKSTIPNAGNGLFALKDFKKDDKIDQYTGRVISSDEADELANNAKPHDPSIEYFIALDNGKVLDVYKSDCLARIANDAEGYSKIKGFSNNSKIMEYPGSKIFLVATKNIPAGSEIFTGYGKHYWDNYKAINK